MLSIYFKLIYSFGIYINIPNNLKINELNCYIKNSIYNTYGINEFYILEGGTLLSEKNNPINENQNILFFDKYTEKDVFYVKPKINIYCSICLLDNHDYTNLSCNHQFCNNCISNWTNRGNNTCPICRTII